MKFQEGAGMCWGSNGHRIGISATNCEESGKHKRRDQRIKEKTYARAYEDNALQPKETSTEPLCLSLLGQQV